MALPTYSATQAAYQLTHGYWDGISHSWALGSSRTLTYAFSSSMTAAERTLATLALQEWSEIANITFVESSSASIRFQNNASGAYCAMTWSGSTMTGATVNIASSWVASYGTGLGSYSFQTYLHEIGHALGLGHTGNYNGSASFARDALYANDSWQTSVMSYFSQTENSFTTASYALLLTPMAFDMAAIRALYGAAPQAHGGATVYGRGSTAGGALDLLGTANFDPAVAFTIVDSSGIDLIDFSHRAEANSIDLRGGSYSDVFGKRGNMAISAETIIEQLRTGAGADRIIGNAAANAIWSGGGNDTVEGGEGDDTIDGGSGNDRLTGGIGADRFVFVGAFGRDEITDFEAGRDQIDLTGVPSLDSWQALLARAVQTAAGVSIIATEGTLALLGVMLASLSAGDFVLASPLRREPSGQALTGTARADSMQGGAGDDTIEAGAGNDRVEAGLGRDLVLLGEGRDIFIDTDQAGLAGSDTVRGGGGNDSIVGSAGFDQCFGEGGNDTIRGGREGCLLDGGDGADVIQGGAGNDTIVGGAGNDRVTDSGGADRVDLGAGNDVYTGTGDGPGAGDTVFGGAGNDRITTLGGDDLLFGDAGNDTISAGAGDDRIDGGTGNDVIYTGDGRDVIVLGPAFGKDRVQDFTRGQDRVDLTALAAIFDDWADVQAGLKPTKAGALLTVGTSSLLFVGVTAAHLQADDFIF